MAYATFDQLETFLGEAHDAPVQPEAERMLARASTLIDAATRGRAALFWESPLPDPVTDAQAAIRDAACAQVEYWLEVGEEHDVVGGGGAAQSVGRWSVSRVPPRLGQRASSILNQAGILLARAGIK